MFVGVLYETEGAGCSSREDDVVYLGSEELRWRTVSVQ